MRYQYYADLRTGCSTNLLMGLVLYLLISRAMARPLLAGKSEHQTQNQLNILQLPVALTIEADPVCA